MFVNVVSGEIIVDVGMMCDADEESPLKVRVGATATSSPLQTSKSAGRSDGSAAASHNSALARLPGPPWGPPRVRNISGGLLCDEPGLGKTITLIALM